MEWTTMSAPHSNGRHSTGLASVLSTTSGMPMLLRDAGEHLEVHHDAARVGQALREDERGRGR